MGIEGLTDVFKSLYKELLEKKPELAGRLLKRTTLSDLRESHLIIDYSMLAFKHGTTSRDKSSLLSMNRGCLTGFCDLLQRLREFDITPVIVFDQVDRGCTTNILTVLAKCLAHVQVEEKLDETINPSKVDAAIILQAKTETKIERRAKRVDREQTTGEIQFKVTDGLVSIVDSVCQFKSVEAHFPLVEADWRIACIAKKLSASHPTYILTEDTDLLLYDIGSAKVLRTFSLEEKVKAEAEEQKKKPDGQRKSWHLKPFVYEMVDPRVAWEAIGMESVTRRAYMGAVLGCDYFRGVTRIGPKSVIHLFVVDPPFLRQARMVKDALPALQTRASISMKRDPYEFSSEKDTGYPKVFLETFTKKMLSPECFNGLSAKDVCALKSPFRVPLKAVVDYLVNHYTQPVSDKRAFQNAATVLAVGPLLEEKYLEFVKKEIEEGEDDEEEYDDESDEDDDETDDDESDDDETDETDDDEEETGTIVGGGLPKESPLVTKEPPLVTKEPNSPRPTAVNPLQLSEGDRERRFHELLKENIDDPDRVLGALASIGINLSAVEKKKLCYFDDPADPKGKGHATD